MFVWASMDCYAQVRGSKGSDMEEYETLFDPFETLLAMGYADKKVFGLSKLRSVEEFRRMT